MYRSHYVKVYCKCFTVISQICNMYNWNLLPEEGNSREGNDAAF